ncbi:phosphatidate cytidylyltransferase [Candidatus Pelagibacter sp. Uisw_130]|uniref:phosphatidate cytidylyltransferase n=1 Tax=Candidatus Pelagibacter sp. Uisw_130 TaxID=3230989 RepID=UPI0039EB62B5
MNSELQKRTFTSIVLIFLLTLMYLYSFIMITALIVIAIIIWVEFYALISKIIKKNKFKDKFLRFFYKAISLLYLSLIVFLIFTIESFYPNQKIYLLYVILVAILSDIGGLIIGKTFKGKKLTKISPNKTISGSVGSFLFSIILIPFFYKNLIEFNFLIMFIITLTISFISQAGDLFISYMKRKAKVKDTSDMLPGHGGFLDRVDGIIFAIPIGLILFNFF